MPHPVESLGRILAFQWNESILSKLVMMAIPNFFGVSQNERPYEIIVVAVCLFVRLCCYYLIIYFGENNAIKVKSN